MQAELVEPALKGTLNVLESCAKTRPKRIVLTSSVVSVLVSPRNVPGAVIDESYWSEPDIVRKVMVRILLCISIISCSSLSCCQSFTCFTWNHNNYHVLLINMTIFFLCQAPEFGAYTTGKTLAEKAAWEFVKKHNLNMVVMNPVFVIGPSLLDSMNTTNEVPLLIINGINFS